MERLLESVATLRKGGDCSAEEEQIRIVLACRSRQKAEVAIATIRKRFRYRTLLLDFEEVDLCCMQNIEDFCKRLLNR